MTSIWILACVAGIGVALLGCATPGSDGQSSSADDSELKLAEAGLPGVLVIRENHGIGSYDAFQISASTIDYKRGSNHLTDAMEGLFVATLEQSLADAAEEAEIPIEGAPGACVMQIDMNLVDVDIDARARGDSLGEMMLVMEFRDSVSGQKLLRYSMLKPIENYDSDDPVGKKIRASFAAMVKSMNLGGALRGAGLADDAIRPGCKGTLADRGRAAASAAREP